MPAPQSTDADAAREQRIDAYLDLVCKLYRSGDGAGARANYAIAAREIAGRTPAQVERMERERGLR